MADLIVGDLTPRNQYTATSGQTAFTYAFPIFTDADLKVYVGTTLKTLTTDYTVSGAGTDNGGTVTLGTGATTDDIVTIYRDIPIARTSDYQINGDLLATTLNDDLDKLTMMSQQNEDQVNNNTLKVDQFDEYGDLTLPAKATRSGTVLGFNATTGDPEAGPTIADTQSLANITADIATLADIEDGTVATNTIQTVAGISANVTTVAGISGNTTTVAGISANVTTVAGISSDVTAVAADATDIGTVAGKATEIGRLGTADAVTDLNTLGTADVVTDMNTLGTSGNVTNMDTLAGISANITTVAGISANTTTVAGISSDVTAVAGKATEVGRLGTAAAVADMAVLGTADVVSDMNILATADVVSDMNTLATSDIIADLNTLATSDIVTDMNVLATADVVADMNTLGTADVVSDMNILGTADNVAAMDTCATNIAGVNSFADRYRVATTAPTTSLDEGDLYFNTTDNKLYHYNGSAWNEITAYTHPTGDGNLHVPANSTTNNGKYLQASGTAGTYTWEAVDALPTQTGNAGKYLTTDATTASWATLDTDANSTTKGLYEHANTISANYTIATGNNALTAGPITINTGVSVTVPTGSTWVIA